MSALEFFGGPWDGQRKDMPHGDKVILHLDTIPQAGAVVSEYIPDPASFKPRLGVYQLVRRRDGDYWKWMGEQ